MVKAKKAKKILKSLVSEYKRDLDYKITYDVSHGPHPAKALVRGLDDLTRKKWK